MNSPNMIEKEFERRLKKNFKKFYCDDLGLSDYEDRIKSRLNEDLGRCRNEVRIIEQNTGTIKGKNVLCIGSGWGGFAVAAGKAGARSVGIEPEKELIEIAKLRDSVRSAECDFIIGKGEKLPFNDGTFDVIECFTVLEHVENPRLVIEEMIRVLKCGGFCYIFVPNYLYPYEEHYKIYWIPMLPKSLAKFQLRLFGRNPDFIDNIKYITPYFISRVLSNLDRKYGIEVKQVNIAKRAKSTQIAKVNKKTTMSCNRIIPKMISKIGSLIGIICSLIGIKSHIEILVRKKDIKTITDEMQFKSGNATLVTIVIVNYNTSDFIRISLLALTKSTNNKYKVIICDNGSRYLDKKKLKGIASKYENVELIFRKQSARGSMGPGEALNVLIDKIATPYGVILDAYATFLKRGWDEILINQLNDKVKIIGAPPVKGARKPKDFPLVFATFFVTKTFRDLNIDMRPKNPKIGQDTGWEMRETFLKNGYTGEVLEVRSTRVYNEGPFRNVICAEYYLEGDDDIFACHFGRGSSLGAAKYKEWNRLLNFPVINHIARKLKGHKEKKQWLNICREIIEAQSSCEENES